METELCWFCEKKSAVASRKYPKPYLIATFKNDSSDSKQDKEELKIPRCIDCARVHIQTDIAKWPMRVGLPTVIAFIISIIILPYFMEFSDGGFLALGACIPSTAVLVGMIIYQRTRNKRLSVGVKDYFDAFEYPPFAEMKEQMTYEKLIDTFPEEQKTYMLSKEPGIEFPAGNVQEYISKVSKVEAILSNITEEEWNYHKYTDVLKEYPIEIKPTVIDQELWNKRLKRGQYEVRNLLLKQVVDHLKKMKDEFGAI